MEALKKDILLFYLYIIAGISKFNLVQDVLENFI